MINDNEFWRYLVHHILQPLELSYPPIQMSIYWGRLIVCLFVCLCRFGLFVTFRSPKPQCTSLGSWYHLKALEVWTKVICWCLDLWCKNYWILNNFVTKISTKSKKGKLVHTLSIVRYPFMNEISWRWFYNFLT
jgi:glycerol-3-phosphate acyltransferase PlsY